MAGGEPRALKSAERVEVTIPARPEFVSVVRLTAAAVAARQGFTYDEVEDLKIAVSEACTWVITGGADPEAPLAVRFGLGLDALEIEVEARGADFVLDPASPPESTALDEHRMGVFVMRCLVDRVDVRHDAGGAAVLRLAKRRAGAAE